MTFTHALSTNNYGPAKFIVDANVSNGTHTTIASAIASASSGDTIFIRPGTYTENLTLKAGVNLTAYTGDSDSPTVKIIGKSTFTTAGSVSLSNIYFQTNSDFIFAVTGSAASILTVNYCYLNCTNNTGISFTSSSTSSLINIIQSSGNLGTTGIALFSFSGAGTLRFYDNSFENTGGSSTANTCSGSGVLGLSSTLITNPITTSSTSIFTALECQLYTVPQNVTCLTTVGGVVEFTSLASGSASAISISSGTLTLCDSLINSTNTNAITGAGALAYSGLSFLGSSSNINTTSQTVLVEGPSKTIGSSNSGNTNTLTLTNSSNTASSKANQVISVAGGTADDAFTTYTVSGVTNWSQGVDNSASDAYVLAAAAALGTNNVMSVATSGEINYPLQPAFLATHSADQNNVTGAGATITVNFTTEITDQNGDYDGTNTFTAPVTGYYGFNCSIRISDLTTAMTSGNISFATSNRSQTSNVANYGAIMTNGNILTLSHSIRADMDAADTCIVTVTISNGAGNTADLASAVTQTYFAGNLIA